MSTNGNNLLKKELNKNKELNNPNHFILYDPQFKSVVLRHPKHEKSFHTQNARNKIRRNPFRHRLTSRNGANINGPTGRPPPLPNKKQSVSARRNPSLNVILEHEAQAQLGINVPISLSSERRQRMKMKRVIRQDPNEATKPTILTREEHNKKELEHKARQAIKNLKKKSRGRWR